MYTTFWDPLVKQKTLIFSHCSLPAYWRILPIPFRHRLEPIFINHSILQCHTNQITGKSQWNSYVSLAKCGKKPKGWKIIILNDTKLKFDTGWIQNIHTLHMKVNITIVDDVEDLWKCASLPSILKVCNSKNLKKTH